MESKAVCETHLPNRKPVARGKVRDIYDLGDRLLIVATDRISAFDWVNPVGIPDKGKILTQISLFWFEQMTDIIQNHLISADLKDFPEDFQAAADQFAGRSMLVHKCKIFPIECVVRGYMAGSGWKEYQKQGTICSISLPTGLVDASKLPEPIFTPSTKATEGHDMNISPAEAAEIVGQDWADKLADTSLKLYKRAHDVAASRGIILCDTKFEFGDFNGSLMLADEVLTPDSSRFWPADQYAPGKPQPSYDKQFVRDYLETTDWDKNSPQPPLPAEVVERTREKYVEAFQKLTGRTDFE